MEKSNGENSSSYLLKQLKVQRILRFFTIVFFIGCLIIVRYDSPSSLHYRPNPKILMFKRINTTLLEKRISYTTDRKRILIYTTLFGRNWYNIPNPPSADYLSSIGCEINNCEVTYNKKLLSSSDALLFHARDMPGVSHLHSIRKVRNPSLQKWTYFISESQANVPSPSALNGLFNITATFKKSSDIWVPYGKYVPLSPDDKRVDNNKNFAAGKQNAVSWFVSHCGLLREAYVKKLETMYPVVVGGNCKNSYQRKMNCKYDCTDELKKYKFYLSFENSFCQEYITEKYWHTPFLGESVPIVMGAGPYDNGIYGGIPGSYINVEDFSSVKELTSYLQYLAKNDTAYNEYFKWKRKYKLWTPVKGWPYPSLLLCGLCEILHQNDYPKRTVDLGAFYGYGANCNGRDQKIKEILSRS